MKALLILITFAYILGLSFHFYYFVFLSCLPGFFPNISLLFFKYFYLVLYYLSFLIPSFLFLSFSFQLLSLFIYFFCLMNRVFGNGLGDWSSIPGRVIPKTEKMVLDAALLNTQHYKVKIMGKVEYSREWSDTLPTLRCSSYWKGSLWVTLDKGRRFYLLYIFLAFVFVS